MAESGSTMREYRTEELAEAAGIPVRTLRFYRERKLLPPPRREDGSPGTTTSTWPGCAPSPPCWSAATPSAASRN